MHDGEHSHGGECTVATFNAVTPELLAAAQKADDAGGQLAQMLNALLQNLEPMAQGLVGQAGGSFQKVKIDINNDLVVINDALNEVAEGIRSAGRDFDVADAESQSEVVKAAADAGAIVNRLRGGTA
jgi:WXG100 family type VII secretion target